MRVLVVDGAGCVGSHMVKMLDDAWHDPVTYDNLSSGFRNAVLCGTVDAGRRRGDPARLVADASLARRSLNWNPRYADIDSIIRHAWQWETRPGGKR